MLSESMLYDSIYIKLENRQNESVILQVREQSHLHRSRREKKGDREGTGGGPGEGGKVLFHDEGSGYSVCSLCENLPELCIYEWCMSIKSLHTQAKVGCSTF